MEIPKSIAFNSMVKKLSIDIQRGNARCIRSELRQSVDSLEKLRLPNSPFDDSLILENS